MLLAVLLAFAPGCITILTHDKLMARQFTPHATPANPEEIASVVTLSLAIEEHGRVALHVGVICRDGTTRHYVGRPSCPTANLETELTWPAATAGPIHFREGSVVRGVLSDGSIGAIESEVHPRGRPSDVFEVTSSDSIWFSVQPPARARVSGGYFSFSIQTAPPDTEPRGEYTTPVVGTIVFVLVCPVTAALDLALLPIELPFVLFLVSALSHMGPAR